MTNDSLHATTFVALAAYLYDLGKFAERAGVFDRDPRLDTHLQLYCPFYADGDWLSHRYAAHTALTFDLIKQHLPDCRGFDAWPFAQVAQRTPDLDPTDSRADTAAAHHKPEMFLQWIVATADRVASGFEREKFEQSNDLKDERAGLNDYTSRLLTLFEQIRFDDSEPPEAALEWRYPLRPLTPTALFPGAAVECEGRDRAQACDEYAALWNGFVEGLSRIPDSHRGIAPMWFDHFDSLCLAFTQAIPAAKAFGVKPEVSLYDHSRACAALAAALWRWHYANGQCDAQAAARLRSRADFSTQKFLLIQGDFSGIQDFVFANGGDTRKQAAKLLRGRSFQVSLFTELAALRILEALQLPPTSQIINAAGKFLIVAPNIPDVVTSLEEVRRDIDQWFIDHTCGQAGIGLAWTVAACQDFVCTAQETGFAQLTKRLFDELDVAKHRRFGLCTSGGRVFTQARFPFGPCRWNGRLPADRDAEGELPASCALSRDQIEIGDSIVKFDRMMVLGGHGAEVLFASPKVRVLETEVFGYRVAFTRTEEVTGQFSGLARSGALQRCWDFELPRSTDADGTQLLWSGYARRFINGYVPAVSGEDVIPEGRYVGLVNSELPKPGDMKTLDMLACEDRSAADGGNVWCGISALGVLKGDIDDLGELFRVGLKRPTLAKYASLSRQINAFFAIWLPWLLQREFPSVYTVFAGGDDFFLIGPWRTVQRLSDRMRREFARYGCNNSGIHFSVGIATLKSGAPVSMLAALAERALSSAKRHGGKNAVTCFGETVAWGAWGALEGALDRLNELRRETRFSSSYVYDLLQFVEMRSEEAHQWRPEAAMWRSRLAYRTHRLLVDQMKHLDEGARRRKFAEIVSDIGGRGIGKLGSAYRIVLFNHLYQFRDC